MSVSKTLLRYGGYVLSVSTARLVGTLLTAATFPFLVRRLGVDVYGLWSYIVAVCGITGLLANPGLTTYTAQQVAAQREKAFDTVSHTLILRVMASGLAIIAILIVARFEVRPDVRFLLKWYGVASVLSSSLSLDYLLPSFELFHVQSFVSILQQSLYAVGVFALVRSPQDIFWVPVSILASSLLTAAIGWIFIWRAGFRFRLAFSPQRWISILVPSAHYAGSSLMSTFYHRSGHLAVRWFLGEHALGIYAAVTRLADVLRNFLSIGQTVLMPRMALHANSPSDLSRLIRVATSILVLLGVPLAVGSLVTAPIVVPWLLGSQFQEAVSPFRWVSPYVLAAPAAALFAGTILYAMGRHREYLFSTIIGAVGAVILYLLLPPFLGIAGACIAFVLGELLVACSALLFCPPEVRRAAFRNWLPALAVGASLAMALALHAARVHNLPPLLTVAAGCSVYFVTCGLLGTTVLKNEFHHILFSPK